MLWPRRAAAMAMMIGHKRPSAGSARSSNVAWRLSWRQPARRQTLWLWRRSRRPGAPFSVMPDRTFSPTNAGRPNFSEMWPARSPPMASARRRPVMAVTVRIRSFHRRCRSRRPPNEIAALAQIARQRSLAVHMDGARFANALVRLNATPAEMTWRSGVDVLSLGATKGGALAAEAVIFFDPAAAAAFGERRKRGGHLLSKHRFIAAQFQA